MSSSLGSTLGVLEVGMIVGSILLGISVLQTYFYYCNFPNDHWGLKFLVALVCILDIGHTGLLGHAIYWYTVTHFGNAAMILKVTLPISLSVFLTGTVTFIVQTFFTYRVYRVTRNIPITVICELLGAIRWGFSIACAVEGDKLGDFVTFGTHFRWLVTSTIVVGAANDVLIALTLCFNLSRQRSGLASTNKVIDKLVAYTMGTGLLTSVVAVSEVICFLTMNNYVWFAQLMVVAKMFSNSLLASLNARTRLRKEINSTYQGSNSTRPTFSDRPINIDSYSLGVRIDMETSMATAEEQKRRVSMSLDPHGTTPKCRVSEEEIIDDVTWRV